MTILDAKSVARLGGWDTRFAVALAFQQSGDVAAALIDTNGDRASIDLDQWQRDADGIWKESQSGSAGEDGVAWSDRLVAMWGPADAGHRQEVEYDGERHTVTTSEHGWWLFVAANHDPTDARSLRPWYDVSAP